jgi:hypothetical protein
MRWSVIFLCIATSALPCAAAESTAPRGADVIMGTADTYQPAARWRWQDVSLELPMSLRTRFEAVNGFPLDRDGTELGKNFSMVPQLRVGGRVEWAPADAPVRFFGEYEHDLVTGTLIGAPDVAGERLPNGEETHNELRKLYGRITFADLIFVSGGFNTSHWGLGLLANDGAHGWTPGSARFSDPRSGDRVLRTTIGTVPLTDYGLVVDVAYDADVVGDETLLKGDGAHEYIFSALAGQGHRTSGGLYLVYREQDSQLSRGLDVFVADVTASTSCDIEGLGTLTLAGEGVLVNGHTTLGPTADFPRHDIFQLGGTLRASLDRGGHGGVLELLYASGDQNNDDGNQNAFHVNPNYEYGLLLFRYVVAGQTGRAPVTAGNLALQGRPVPDLERVPTGGSPINTIAFFPRAWWRPRNGLEAYGGPLFAFSEVNNVDPFNTQEAGGAPRNALNGNPGSFWGTELDLGVRYRALLNGAEVTLGIEAGALFPGSALRDAAGNRMDEVFGGRAMIDYRL